jgi:hypothetical protein
VHKTAKKFKFKWKKKKKAQKLTDIDKLKRISGLRPCQTDWL